MKNSDNFCFISKINDLPSDLDFYIERVYQFIGAIILLGNSLILRITNLFEQLNEKYKKDGTLGNKIKSLENIGYKRLKMNKEVFNTLLEDIGRFKKYLNLAKHSLFAGDPEIIKKTNIEVSLGDITTLQIYKFSEKEQEEIHSLGSKLNREIAKISKRINAKE